MGKNTHNGEIAGLMPTCAKVGCQKEKYSVSEIISTVMPNNEPVIDFFYEIVTKLNDFIYSSLVIITGNRIKKLKIKKGQP